MPFSLEDEEIVVKAMTDKKKLYVYARKL